MIFLKIQTVCELLSITYPANLCAPFMDVKSVGMGLRACDLQLFTCKLQPSCAARSFMKSNKRSTKWHKVFIIH